MNFENKKIETDLLGKYLAGEASPEEAMLLDEWLTDPENKREFEQFAKLWSLMNPSEVPAVPPTQRAWSAVQHSITHPPRSFGLRTMLNRYTIAASIIGLGLLATYFLMQKNSGNQPIDRNELSLITKTATSEKVTDTMSDGSVVIINKSSSIIYAKEFSDSIRELVLTGEAYFNVTPNKTKPFIITLDDLKIQVIGTSFNVRKLSTTGNVEVQVQSGVVKMFTSEKELIVARDQTGIYTKPDRSLKLKDTIDLNSIGYATSSFYFNDISLTAACSYLAHAFNVEIEIDAEKIGECRITAQFNNKSLSYILEVINATLNTTYTKDGNTIHIKGSGCQ